VFNFDYFQFLNGNSIGYSHGSPPELPSGLEFNFDYFQFLNGNSIGYSHGSPPELPSGLEFNFDYLNSLSGNSFEYFHGIPAAAVVPTVPGLEFTLPKNRLHFEMRDENR